MSRRVEAWLAAIHRPGDPGRVRRWLRRSLITLAVVHLVMWGLGLPWPHRFSASVLAAGAAAWLASRPGRARDTMRRLLSWLLPETRGRGLWGGVARRRLLEDLVARGDPARLVSGETLLIVSALALDSGRIVHFAAGENPGPAFEAGVDQTLTEVVWMSDPGQVVDAAVASSAIPLAFEPVRIGGREFVDAGQFSNQPLDAAVAAGADAILVVLTAPSGGTGVRRRESNLVELSARLLEVASWRQLNLQLAAHGAENLRAGREGAPAVVVVEPVAPLPGGLLAFDAGLADELMRRGDEDARSALARAGWIEPGPA
jgi:predicted acylesterase/phospholipase RssA